MFTNNSEVITLRPCDIHLLLCIQCWTPNDGQKTCPKHVELYSKNKCEKLVHLVGFIMRIYHDARSSECEMSVVLVSGLAVVTRKNKTRVQVVCCQSTKYLP